MSESLSRSRWKIEATGRSAWKRQRRRKRERREERKKRKGRGNDRQEEREREGEVVRCLMLEAFD